MHLMRHWFPVFLVAAVHALLLALMLQSGPKVVTPPQVMEMMLLAPVEAAPLPEPPEPAPPPPVVPPPPKVEPKVELRVSPPVVETQVPAPVVPQEPVQAVPEPLPVPPAPVVPQTPAPAAEPVVQPRIDASYKGNPKPVYPPLSRRLGEAGVVTLRVYVKEDGTVGEMQLQRSSGFPRLDRSAMDAVGRWKFVPAKRGAQPFATWYTLPVNFDLEK